MEQFLWKGKEGYRVFLDKLREKSIQKLFLVCDKAISFLPLEILWDGLKALDVTVTYFSEFESNLQYESLAEGVEQFHRSGSEMILAIGGGSAIDVAKCVKLYSNMDKDICYLEQEIIPNNTELFAIPTTAGTGSETTRYTVIYYQGEKQSITHPSCIPSGVILDAKLLKTLPDYQKKPL